MWRSVKENIKKCRPIKEYYLYVSSFIFKDMY